MVYISNRLQTTPIVEDLRGTALEGFIREILSFNQVRTHIYVGDMNATDLVEETHYAYEGVYQIRLDVVVENIPPKYWETLLWPKMIAYAKEWDCKLYRSHLDGGLNFLVFYLHDQPFGIVERPAVQIGDVVTTNQV